MIKLIVKNIFKTKKKNKWNTNHFLKTIHHQKNKLNLKAVIVNHEREVTPTNAPLLSSTRPLTPEPG